MTAPLPHPNKETVQESLTILEMFARNEALAEKTVVECPAMIYQAMVDVCSFLTSGSTSNN